MALPSLDDYFPDWKEREALAEAMIPIIGRLYRKNVVTYCYGRALYNQSVVQIMKTHRYVRQIAENELSEFESYPILEALSQLDLGPSHVDVGKLAITYMDESENSEMRPLDFVKRECAKVIGRHVPPVEKPQDIVLYGFGRIGRLLTRLLVEKTGSGEQLRLRAIVVRKGSDDDLVKRASLLRRDSVHGAFLGTLRIDHENCCLIANGNVIRVIYASGPDQVDYESYGIHDAIVIDNTGVWRDEEGLGLHLKNKGAAKVILTAPAKGDLKNIVSGLNSDILEPTDSIIGAASCTTNAIVPVLKAVNDEYEIVHGHMETVHAYTNDQNLIDNYHKKNRRGRGAPLNMVITETGASKAVVKLLPELEGKLTGNAIRVPTPNVSLAILNLTLGRETSTNEVNDFLRNTSLHSELQRQIDFTRSPEVVSSDFVGNRHACIVDGGATLARDNRIVLYVWYDNEFGYACQVVRVVQKWAGISYPLVPKDVDKQGF
ncbi:MAG: glyceraldehyde-3-phosphate dehydrogenase [Pseudomonadales bacterium]|nr:glyceraldehyde-3-phosphate dehydrogenase [Pseudomonadales bacterium]MDP6471360.1 glyceraldehyde-3-phosphate dehydrogenase [Pseudomonadales bacterium]MDP6826448.1 glyceraldehyde-3-phosphate dehydrogenase [Pseudomonadales bacterium]MDP6970097.1 glyceraldehyde-3-phosphate dehydrogenase [Pseudomonadales bacterium]